jgi:hypothetical protein
VESGKASRRGARKSERAEEQKERRAKGQKERDRQNFPGFNRSPSIFPGTNFSFASVFYPSALLLFRSFGLLNVFRFHGHRPAPFARGTESVIESLRADRAGSRGAGRENSGKIAKFPRVHVFFTATRLL